MDEAPGRIEMRRTVERNRRQLSVRLCRTVNQSDTIQSGFRSPHDTLSAGFEKHCAGRSAATESI